MQEGVPELLVKFRRLGLEPVRVALAAALAGARERGLDLDVQNEREIRPEVRRRHPFKRLDQERIHVAKRPLVDAGRIDKTITDDPMAARERGLDRVAHMIVAGGREQDRLRLRPEWLGRARKQNMPDNLGPGRAARLACEDDADAKAAQPLCKRSRMGRFARALAALESNETSPHLRHLADSCRSHGSLDSQGLWSPKRDQMRPLLFVSNRCGPQLPPEARDYSRWMPARNSPMNISVAASQARRGNAPWPTSAAASSGTSSAMTSPRHTFNVPIFCPFCTGGRTGPE